MKHPIIAQLRMERRGQQITQLMLSEITGYHRNQFNQYETGRHSPKLETLEDWADALGFELKLVKKQT